MLDSLLNDRLRNKEIKEIEFEEHVIETDGIRKRRGRGGRLI